jgi:hypothetical protein
VQELKNEQHIVEIRLANSLYLDKSVIDIEKKFKKNMHCF